MTPRAHPSEPSKSVLPNHPPALSKEQVEEEKEEEKEFQGTRPSFPDPPPISIPSLEAKTAQIGSNLKTFDLKRDKRLTKRVRSLLVEPPWFSHTGGQSSTFRCGRAGDGVVSELFPEKLGQNLAFTVFCVPNLLDSGAPDIACRSLEKGVQTPVAQGRSTEVISMIHRIRTTRLSIKNSFSRGRVRRLRTLPDAPRPLPLDSGQ